MNITVLAFQVQKKPEHLVPWGNEEWTFIARFPTLEAAQSFLDQHKDEYAGDYHRSVLRVFCEPADVAKALRAAQLAGAFNTRAPMQEPCDTCGR